MTASSSYISSSARSATSSKMLSKPRKGSVKRPIRTSSCSIPQVQLGEVERGPGTAVIEKVLRRERAGDLVDALLEILGALALHEKRNIHDTFLVLRRIHRDLAEAGAERLDDPLGLFLALPFEALLEPAPELDHLGLRGGVGASEELIAQGRELLVRRDEVLEDVVDIPVHLEAHLDLAIDAVELRANLVEVPAQRPDHLVLALGDVTEGHGNDGRAHHRLADHPVVRIEVLAQGQDFLAHRVFAHHRGDGTCADSEDPPRPTVVLEADAAVVFVLVGSDEPIDVTPRGRHRSLPLSTRLGWPAPAAPASRLR